MESLWQRWLRQPQKIWLRRAFFQIHLWSGIALGLYILVISVTGSVLVYRNELLRAATLKPVMTTGSGPLLTDDQLTALAKSRYTGYRVVRIGHPRNPDQALDLWLSPANANPSDKIRGRLVDPRTGVDLGNSVPVGISLISQLADLHDNLFAGHTGRVLNGLGAVASLALAITGLIIWWPGMRTWRRSLVLHGGVGWKRFTWDLHSVIGFWSMGFVVIFGLSGIYLCFPEWVQDIADRIEPITDANARGRIGDQVIYWLAYLHFGRIQGIGIPCKGPGVCDQATKATWALFGLAPAGMFVTGAIMWWNRVVRPRLAASPDRAYRDSNPVTSNPGDVPYAPG